jgi:hypothetical protein
MNGIRRAGSSRGAGRGGISMRALRDGLSDREDLINMTCAFELRVSRAIGQEGLAWSYVESRNAGTSTSLLL